MIRIPRMMSEIFIDHPWFLFAFEEESDEDNKIYFSDLYVSQDVFQQSRLVFPFFSSHSEARAAFQSVVNEQGWRLTNQHGTVYLSCVHEGPLLTIQNLLQVPSDAFTWGDTCFDD